MSSSFAARRGQLTALTVVATAVLFFVGLAQGSASAAEVTKGSVAITINSGKAGKVSAIKPAKVVKRIGKKGARVKSAVANGKVAGKATARVKGGIRFNNGKRKVKLTGLNVTVYKKQTVISGKLGGKKMNVFKARGKTNLNQKNGLAKLSGAKLSLTNAAAAKLRKSLKLKKAPKGKLGGLFVHIKVTSNNPVDPCVANPNGEGCQPVDPCVSNPNGAGCPITDPYLAQCNVGATSKVTGSLPAASPLPTLASPKATNAPASVAWGFKSSFLSYLIFGASGSVHGLDGATVNQAGPVPSGFNFPVANGSYSDNGTPELSDDQAIVNTTGTAVMCATGHNFRVVISDPTFVVDGENSRIIASVDTNLTGVWTEPQRIDLADLDLGQITEEPVLDEENAPTGDLSIDWGSLPATLTQSGADAICGTGEQAACTYTAGTEIDPVNLKIEVTGTLPVDTYNAECGVPVAKVISNSWPTAAPVPELTDGVATTAPTTIDWGFKSSFRSYVQLSPPPGSIQGLDGATTISNPVPPNVPLGFSFPVSEGEYAQNDPVDTADDQAVINGSGTGLFCKAGHGFWASISNPTIIIDGENSRIVADISQNTYGPGASDPWQTSQRVTLANLNLSGITPTYGAGTVEWASVPAAVSADAGPFATYPADTELDPITVSLATE